jgi:acetyltransferase-like isoleucine patch superfamily enzyme
MARTLVKRDRIPWSHLALFGWLPSPLKRLAYRTLLGYRIGRSVQFGVFGVVVGRDVELGDHVAIGSFAIVQGRRIRIGRHSSVGTFSYVACEHIEIGEDAKIREQVFVGGPQLPESSFVLGSRTIVLQMAYINPTKPVVIGDDTGIGGHCLIFTHGSWLNILDGYPVTFAPVTLGKSVWLPWRVFLMPGVTIGDGSVIGANSLVTGSIPPYSLAMGTPAKVVKSAPNFPRRPTPEQRAGIVAEMVREFDRYMEYSGVRVTVEGDRRAYQSRDAGGWRLHWRPGGAPPPDTAVARGDTVLSEVPLEVSVRLRYRGQGVYWLDLAGYTRSSEGSPLTEELAAFVGRYGIRLPRDDGGGRPDERRTPE